MARTVFITGNDGSGKSTFLGAYESRLRSFGINTTRRHYYDSLIRTLLRGLIGFLIGIANQKNVNKNALRNPAGRTRNTSNSHHSFSMVKRVAILAFLWLYQSLMGLEARWRDLIGRNRVLLMDRCYIDDLVSIVEMFDIQVPITLVRWSSWLFPVRIIFYLSADSEEEYSRIVELDLSKEVHRRKHERYKQIIKVVEATGGPIHWIDTSSS